MFGFILTEREKHGIVATYLLRPPDIKALYAAALREIVLKQHAQITSHDAEIERLRR